MTFVDGGGDDGGKVAAVDADVAEDGVDAGVDDEGAAALEDAASLACVVLWSPQQPATAPLTLPVIPCRLPCDSCGCAALNGPCAQTFAHTSDTRSLFYPYAPPCAFEHPCACRSVGRSAHTGASSPSHRSTSLNAASDAATVSPYSQSPFHITYTPVPPMLQHVTPDASCSPVWYCRPYRTHCIGRPLYSDHASEDDFSGDPCGGISCCSACSNASYSVNVLPYDEEACTLI